MSDCLVVIPAYNEAQNIEAVLAELRSELPTVDVLVVDDGSRDDTAARARQAGAVAVRLPNNLGYGGAVQTGFRYAARRGYQLVVLMDADGQHDPRDIRALLAPVEAGNADVALGSRFLGHASYPIGWDRRLGMALFRWLVRLLAGQQVTDPTSGFQALDRRAFEFFAWDNYPVDFPDADTLVLLLYSGFRVQEVPVRMHARRAGHSMHNPLRGGYYIFRMVVSLLILLLRQKTRTQREATSKSPTMNVSKEI